MKSKATDNPTKVMLLALGDDYWTPFVKDMREALAEAGIESIIVVDSRAGEYQCYGKRSDEDGSKKYFFSDFVNGKSTLENKASSLDKRLIPKAMFSDFYRLTAYGAHKTLKKIDWNLLKSQMASFFEQIILKENVSVILHDQISSSFSYVCYITAQAHGVRYLGLVGARVPKRYEARESIYDDWKQMAETYQRIQSGAELPSTEEMQWAEDYLSNIDKQVPSYMDNNFLNTVKLDRYLNKRKGSSYLNKLKYHLLEYDESSKTYFKETPFVASHRSFIRNLKRIVLKKYFEKIEEDIDLKWLEKNAFFIYPIHYQPEASTSVGSPEFVNQLDFIRNVAFNLPPNKWLLVKEHQSAIGYHSKNFYDSIKLLPNVRLIGPKWNIKELIRKSEGVITLTSTAGMECLLLNKPVYLFGNVFYRFHPLCTKISSWDDLSKRLESCAERRSCDNTAFLIAYRRHTREGVIDYDKPGWGIRDDLVALIKDYIQQPQITVAMRA